MLSAGCRTRVEIDRQSASSGGRTKLAHWNRCSVEVWKGATCHLWIGGGIKLKTMEMLNEQIYWRETGLLRALPAKLPIKMVVFSTDGMLLRHFIEESIVFKLLLDTNVSNGNHWFGWWGISYTRETIYFLTIKYVGKKNNLLTYWCMDCEKYI